MRTVNPGTRVQILLVVAVILGPIVLTACGRTASTDSGDPAAASPAAAPDAQEASSQVSMTTGQGNTMTLTLLPLPDSREYIYCELLPQYGDRGFDIYSTSPLAPCSLEWWENLDLDVLAQEFGAEAVVKNGVLFCSEELNASQD